MTTPVLFATLTNYEEDECPFEIVFVNNLLGSEKKRDIRAKVDKLVSDVGVNYGVIHEMMPTMIEVIQSFHNGDFHITARAYIGQVHIGTFHIPDGNCWLDSMRATTIVTPDQPGVTQYVFADSTELMWRGEDCVMLRVL